MHNYVVFILTHGRANHVMTYNTLRRCGYNGKVYFVVDDTDKQIEQYCNKFGKENILVFNKQEALLYCDTCDLSGTDKIVLPARNICFELAKKLNVEYFIELDDDYNNFSYIFIDGADKRKRGLSITGGNLDKIFEAYFSFFDTSEKLITVSFSQGGDYICDRELYYDKRWMRKAMNVFFCSTKRPFKFLGRINEDTCAYATYNQVGNIFCTVSDIQINQGITQANSSGLTDAYLDMGTYLKSFYTVICAPSCVKIRTMGSASPRIHHLVDWESCAVKIISSRFKKVSHE